MRKLNESIQMQATKVGKKETHRKHKIRRTRYIEMQQKK